jgi:hypothetical protein
LNTTSGDPRCCWLVLTLGSSEVPFWCDLSSPPPTAWSGISPCFVYTRGGGDANGGWTWRNNSKDSLIGTLLASWGSFSFPY